MFEINNIVWIVRFVPFDDIELMRNDGSFSLGICDRNTRTIYINENLRNDLLKRVICHEVTHAVMFSYNIDLSIEQEEFLADLVTIYGKEIIKITDMIFIN